jgi:hypothetical protein
MIPGISSCGRSRGEIDERLPEWFFLDTHHDDAKDFSHDRCPARLGPGARRDALILRLASAYIGYGELAEVVPARKEPQVLRREMFEFRGLHQLQACAYALKVIGVIHGGRGTEGRLPGRVVGVVSSDEQECQDRVP